MTNTTDTGMTAELHTRKEIRSNDNLVYTRLSKAGLGRELSRLVDTINLRMEYWGIESSDTTGTLWGLGYTRLEVKTEVIYLHTLGYRYQITVGEQPSLLQRVLALGTKLPYVKHLAFVGLGEATVVRRRGRSYTLRLEGVYYEVSER